MCDLIGKPNVRFFDETKMSGKSKSPYKAPAVSAISLIVIISAGKIVMGCAEPIQKETRLVSFFFQRGR